MSRFDIPLQTEKINKALSDYNFGDEPSNLYAPLDYILTLGGKRIRPLLTLFGSYLFSDEYQKALVPGLATEVFHNFSLIHDDIMDEAPLRRGKATVHEKWNQNIAILSGDVMLVKAYEILANIPPELLPEALTLFNKCATEVCDGQQYDMDFETRNDVSEDEYLMMIKLKTAVLLGFSLRLGALIGGANNKDCELIEQFGTNVGIGFQLKDDLLDVFGEQEKVGKQVGGDIISNKKTYLLINALKEAKGETLTSLENWIEKTDFDSSEKVNAVKSIYLELGIDKLAEGKMNYYFEEGFKQLEQLSCDAAKKAELASFAKWLIERDK